MAFQIGKFYTHSTGEVLSIIGEVETTMYGKCLVAESSNRPDLIPVGRDEDAMANWSEVPYEVWSNCFSKD